MTAAPRKLDVARTDLPPVRCAPWCWQGDGHADAGHPDDQWCSSVDLTVLISSGEPVKLYEGATEPAVVRVLASCDPGEAPFVVFRTPPSETEKLTPNEADELAAVLKHAAWVARQGGSSR